MFEVVCGATGAGLRLGVIVTEPIVAPAASGVTLIVKVCALPTWFTADCAIVTDASTNRFSASPELPS